MGAVIKILVVVAAFVLNARAADVRHENSLLGPFKVTVPGGAENDIENWTKTQSALIAENLVRLTTDEPHVQGAIWNYKPVHINDFEFHVDVQIHGAGAHTGGNGMAIWYTRDPYITGPVFGYSDYFSGLGIFIDTLENPNAPHKHAHPYISAVVNNGSLPYSHGEDGTMYQVGGCHMPVRNLPWPIRVAVSYISNALAVYVDLGGQQQGWQLCFKTEGVYLPTGYFLGLTASTGEHADNHDIMGVTTLDMNIQNWEDKAYIVPHAEHIQILPSHYALHEEAAHVIAEDDDDDDSDDDSEPEHEPQAQQQQQQQRAEQPKVEERKDDVVAEEIPAPSASLFRKVVYLGGAAIMLYVAVTMLRRYLAQRKERMHKRLF